MVPFYMNVSSVIHSGDAVLHASLGALAGAGKHLVIFYILEAWQ